LLAALSIYRWRVNQHGDPDHMTVSGTVEADQVSVGSKVGGRVVELLVHEGDAVTTGQLLAKFDTDELTARQHELEAGKTAAEAQEEKLRNGPRVQELTQAHAAVEAASAQLEQLLHGNRKEDIAAAEAAWQAAEALAIQAGADYGRAEQLFEQDVIARSDLDAAKGRADSSRRSADAARQQYDKARAGARPEEIAAARARLNQAQASYDLLAAGARPEDVKAAGAQVQQAAAELEVLATQLDESRVVAPANGVILTVNRQTGDLVSPGQAVFDLLLSKTYYIQLFIPENKLSWAAPGTTASVSVDTYPGQTFTGHVTYLSTQGEFTPRNLQTTEKRVEQTFRCKVTIDDAEGKLRPGMVCDVVFDKPAQS
jgi:multidrug resistance efflux pump